MKQRWLPILIAAILGAQAAAAEELDLAPLRLSVAYFGDWVSHPGADMAVTYRIFKKDIYELELGARAGGYVHPRNHGALFISSILMNRVRGENGAFGEFELGCGYHHSWLTDPVYALGAKNQVEQIADAGSPHLMPSIGIGGGVDLQELELAPISLFARLQVYGIFPINQAFVPALAVQVGVSFTPFAEKVKP